MKAQTTSFQPLLYSHLWYIIIGKQRIVVASPSSKLTWLMSCLATLPMRAILVCCLLDHGRLRGGVPPMHQGSVTNYRRPLTALQTGQGAPPPTAGLCTPPIDGTS